MIIRTAALVSFCLIAMPALAYIYGYERLYVPETQKTIDLLYEVHMPEQIEYQELYSTPYAAIKERLYKTEKRFLEALERIDSSGKAQQTAVLWESSRHCPFTSNYFANYADHLVAERLKNISLVHADNARRLLKKACNTRVNSSRDPNFAYHGVSFNRPFTLSSNTIRAIIANSGHKAWLQYERHYTETIACIQRYTFDTFSRLRYESSDIFAAWTRLADSEMLSQILSSPKKRIIVYCGGSHLRRISAFLKKVFACQVHCALHTGPITGTMPEIDLSALNLLDADAPLSSQINGLFGGYFKAVNELIPTLARALPLLDSLNNNGTIFEPASLRSYIPFNPFDRLIRL